MRTCHDFDCNIQKVFFFFPEKLSRVIIGMVEASITQPNAWIHVTEPVGVLVNIQVSIYTEQSVHKLGTIHSVARCLECQQGCHALGLCY